MISSEPDARPTIAIVGAGAIGTSVADAISSSADVTLCRRRNPRPMAVEWNGERRKVDAAVATSANDLSPVDWVVIATKAHHTASLGDWLTRLIGQRTRLVLLQNGIDHAARVAEWVDASRVVPGIVYLAAEKSGGDLVVRHGDGTIALPDNRNARDFGALLGDRVAARYTDAFDTESWNKLILNAALNPLTALHDRAMEIAHDPAVRPTLYALLDEGAAVARASGVAFDASHRAAMLDHIDTLPPLATTSMLLDRRHGRALEYDYLTGAIIAAADRHGVAVPRLRDIHRQLVGLSTAPTI
ncbi:2-dehydropantoate 2-reductase [Lacisediminihabitans changchengi]|uniref:2-dehydropantoate 2-reductase n=1 Tax=Lacisediminihabitans changchengi TaxID=2787634 RepID=A0A934SLB9_9MICO|nr:2-dehydropantoate 2-reductase [Lacisediminihabitans changchengi]MBK4348817.1 2-dehydropantoate 2-reductase [Lacisediminihabitans changchengi]